MGENNSEFDKMVKEDGLDDLDVRLSKFIKRVINQEKTRKLILELMKEIKDKY